MNKPDNIQSIVRERYAATARAGLSTDHDGVRAVAEAFGYSADELSAIPAEANMGLSCGNPIATANLRPGEVVVDLGSGGGLDVFLAAAKVGPSGRAIGIDMTPDMVELARRNAARGNASGHPYDNVEFRLGTIERIPLPDASADVIISNCVINLATDKSAVFREMFRVLKPGGRVAVSDIALKQPLPDDLARDVMAYVGCIAGAIERSEYDRGLRAAGFAHVAVVDSGADLNAYSKVEGQAACCSPTGTAPVRRTPATVAAPAGACCSAPAETAWVPLPVGTGCCSAPAAATAEAAAPGVHSDLAGALARYDVNDYAASVRVYAVKPA